jgi:hypothetical protein
VGNEEPHVYLRDSQGKERFYENIRPTQNGTEVLIPLQYFGAVVDLSKLAEIRIAFEWKSMSGTVFVDEIGFAGKQKFYLPSITFAPPPTPTPPPIPVPEPTLPPCADLAPMCTTPGSYEPNNRRCSATPLASGVKISSEICGPTDNRDNFVITVTKSSRIDVRLSNIPEGADYDVWLYNSVSEQTIAGSDGNGKEEKFSYDPNQPGKYYILVYRSRGFSEEPYTLEVTYE